MERLIKHALLLCALLLLGACSSGVPELIRNTPAGDPQLGEVKHDPQRFKSSQVRWGGAIARTENRAEHTDIEIVGRKLDSDGEPIHSDSSQGRFIARIKGFLDPLIYAEKRNITISGRVTGLVEGTIGEHHYQYPLIEADIYHLWPERSEQQCYHCSPYGDPWWPYPPYWPYRPYY